MYFLAQNHTFCIIFRKAYNSNDLICILFFRVAKLLDCRIKVGRRNIAQFIAKLQSSTKADCIHDTSSVSKFLCDKSRGALAVDLFLKRCYINFVFMVVSSILEFSTAKGLGEQHLFSNKLIRTSRCGAFHISPFKSVVKVLFVGNKQLNRVAGILRNCLQQKNRFEYTFLVRIKALIPSTIVIVQNRANIMR